MALNNLVEADAPAVSDTPVTQAVFVANHDNGSEAWHALRATGIGGSEVGTICGLNKWESPYTLWAKKSGRLPSVVEPNEAMEWGTRLEPVILDKFADSHPELQLLRNVGTWSHPDRPWQLANPDAVYKSADGTYGIVEVKTAQYEDDWVNGIPPHYEAQVQWYMQVFGYSHAYVVALFHGNRYREIEIAADTFAQDAALQTVEMFRTYLDTDTQPDFDGANSTYQTVRALHPDIDDKVEVELGYLGQQYFTIENDYKAAEQKLNLIRTHILDAMGTAKRGLVEGQWTFTRSSRAGGTPFLTIKRG